MNNEKYLPIGSIVLLKGATKKLMITGFCSISNENKEVVYDYAGVMFPEGAINNEVALFNHDQIDKIFYIGYVDEEQKEFVNVLRNFIAKKELNNIKPVETQNN